MEDKRLTVAEKYLVALRIIQPARIQDIEAAVHEIWPEDNVERTSLVLKSVHEKMRDENYLVSIRRGTYMLNRDGMSATEKIMKERDIDNARLFLMKRQRKRYHRNARWLG